jgi:hypothetical protein
MKSLRLAALAAALVLGACTSATPTDPAASTAHPSFDGGPGMVGSGNFTGETQDGGGMLGSGNGIGAGGGTTTLDTGGTTTSNDTTAQRGPGMMGSGN